MSEQQRLVVFSDDWGRHPSSCQHLVRHLTGDCDVAWVNTIGTRSPRFNLHTLSRGWEKLRQWRRRDDRTAAPDPQQPRVLNPTMWPGFRSGWQRRLNRRMLGRFLQRNVAELSDTVVLTTIPVVSDLVGVIPARRWVYYCVDDFSAWPGLDSQPLREMEEKLIARADRIVAAGENLSEQILRLGRQASLITHGIDLSHWQLPVAADPDLQDLPRPVILFWGLIDRRLDTAFLATLGHTLTTGSIVLVGPEQHPDPVLERVPRLIRIGAVPYDRLPAIAAAADVLMMPYADLPVTRAMQPLKLKEYMATGKPVVARSLPAVEPWSDCLDAVENDADFAQTILKRTSDALPADQRAARQRLADEGWDAKALQLCAVLFDES